MSTNEPEDHEKEWRKTQQIFREIYPPKRDRTGRVYDCCTTVPRLLRDAIRILYPTRLSDVPTPETFAKLQCHTHVFGHRARLKVLLKDLPKLCPRLVHPELIVWFCRPIQLSAAEEQLFQKVRKLLPRTTLDNFSAAFQALCTLCASRNLYSSPCEPLDLPFPSSSIVNTLTSLKMGHFCVQEWSPRLRRALLLACGAREVHVDASIAMVAEAKQRFRTFRAQYRNKHSFMPEHYYGLMEHLDLNDPGMATPKQIQSVYPQLTPTQRDLLKALCVSSTIPVSLSAAASRSNLVRLSSLSPWHAELCASFRHHESRGARTFFPTPRLNSLGKKFGAFMLHLDHFARQACPDNDNSLCVFLKTCTRDQLAEAIRTRLRTIRTVPTRVKSQSFTHHALAAALDALRFINAPYLQLHIRCDTSRLTSRLLLLGVENHFVPASPNQRRNYSQDELQAMKSVLRGPMEELLFVMLCEVAPRTTALRHMTYDMLVNEKGLARYECQVPEKGARWRGFVCSENLQAKINTWTTLLRSRHAALDSQDPLGSWYVFSNTGTKLPSTSSFYAIVRRWARDANVTSVAVCTHGFRGTLVNNLLMAKNPIEVVSKFMGHASVTTTSRFYHLATPAELRLVNPFAREYQETQEKPKIQKIQKIPEQNQEQKIVEENPQEKDQAKDQEKDENLDLQLVTEQLAVARNVLQDLLRDAPEAKRLRLGPVLELLQSL